MPLDGGMAVRPAVPRLSDSAWGPKLPIFRVQTPVVQASWISLWGRNTTMTTTTILIIIAVILLFGGGWGYSRRGR
jgi:hypothetical protein